MAPLDTYDQQLLAGEFLSLALSDLDDLERRFVEAASPDSEDQLTDEALGRLAAFFSKVERDAEALRCHVARIRDYADRVYHLDADREQRESDRILSLLDDWQRARSVRDEGLPCTRL